MQAPITSQKYDFIYIYIYIYIVFILTEYKRNCQAKRLNALRMVTDYSHFVRITFFYFVYIFVFLFFSFVFNTKWGHQQWLVVIAPGDLWRLVLLLTHRVLVLAQVISPAPPTTVVQPWYNRGTTAVQPWYNRGTTMVQSWYNRGTTVVQPWYNRGTTVVQPPWHYLSYTTTYRHSSYTTT